MTTQTLAVPDPPTGLTASVAGGDVQLQWTDNSDLESAYRVLRQQTGLSSFDVIATLDANSTSYVDAGLPVGEFTYRVRALNESGQSLADTVTVGVLGEAQDIRIDQVEDAERAFVVSDDADVFRDVENARHRVVDRLTLDGTAQIEREAQAQRAECAERNVDGLLGFQLSRGVERQRKAPGEMAGNEPLQDHHALLLNRAAHLDRALDVHDTLPSGRGARGDTAGRTKAVIAEVADREAVDLPDIDPFCVDHHGTVGDAFVHAIFDARIPVAPLAQRSVDFLRRDRLGPVRLRDLRGFAQHVVDLFELRGQLAPMTGPARGNAQQLGDRAVVACRVVKRARSFADQAGVDIEVAAHRVQITVDIGLDLEVGLKLGVDGKERVVPVRRSNDDHLDLERHWLGPGGAGNGYGVRTMTFLELDDAVAKRLESGLKATYSAA